jgi:hypothetical protein
MNSESRKGFCKNCSETLTEEVKEFCSSKCKNSYEKRLNLTYFHKITANKRILQKLDSDNIKIISREDLIRGGFDFDYYSQYDKNMILTDKIYFFEYGLEALVSNKYKIIKVI